MGLLSALAPGWLLARTPLARAVAGYIAAYWGARLAIQFLYFDRSAAPKGAFFAAGEAALVLLFAALAAVYSFTAIDA